ncbi:helix-turn-helix transcriptional regulator [Tahibacter soli]|jgi:DNA-binding NarL/FixJ family response regulator|uniref:Response regulator transcription factor n=1 Tax=Tahibacter soli TaxID=2983605 RepID=A0A9X4BM73_9GAMM|nr:response regulator transcription factor [Tahibacter soli]MDC8016047.1 response regulator transcription factor [Tahibacter soli]
MRRSTWLLILGYGALAAALLVCLRLLAFAPFVLDWGRELTAAAIAIVALVIGLRLAERRASAPSSNDTAPETPPAIADAGPLSARQRQILALLAAGRTNKEIARELVVSENTIKTHLANLYAKLGVGRRTEALAEARRQGLFG